MATKHIIDEASERPYANGELLRGDVVRSRTLPGHPVGTVMAYGEKDVPDPDVFVIWHPGQGRPGGRNCKIRLLELLPDERSAFGLPCYRAGDIEVVEGD